MTPLFSISTRKAARSRSATSSGTAFSWQAVKQRFHATRMHARASWRSTLVQSVSFRSITSTGTKLQPPQQSNEARCQDNYPIEKAAI